MRITAKPQKPRSISAFAAALAVSSLLCSNAAIASVGTSDPMIEGAKLCTRYLPRHEREYGIPVHLLAAIASNESGRYHKGVGLTIPWPWTINVEGKGYYFETKQEAIAAVQKYQAQGIRSIDVGCMQVNLKHHPDAFASLSDAFEPRFNVAYAAHFLRSNYDDLGNWRSAAAAYHSRTPDFGNKYVYGVYTRWNQILTKIAEAKGGKAPVNADFDVATANDAPPLARGDLASAKKEAGSQKQAFAPRSVAQKNERKPIRMRMIELTKRDRSKENGVVVIRPEPEELQIASADTPVNASFVASSAMGNMEPAANPTSKPSESLSNIEPAAGQFNPSAKVIRINGGKFANATAPAKQFTPRKTPQFVFDN